MTSTKNWNYFLVAWPHLRIWSLIHISNRRPWHLYPFHNLFYTNYAHPKVENTKNNYIFSISLYQNEKYTSARKLRSNIKHEEEKIHDALLRREHRHTPHRVLAWSKNLKLNKHLKDDHRYSKKCWRRGTRHTISSRSIRHQRIGNTYMMIENTVPYSFFQEILRTKLQIEKAHTTTIN